MYVCFFLSVFKFLNSMMDGWKDGWFGALCPFQQYFSHIRTIEG